MLAFRLRRKLGRTSRALAVGSLRSGMRAPRQTGDRREGLGGGHRPEGAARAAAHDPRKRNGAASSCAGFEKRCRLLPRRLWLGWFAVHSGKRRILEDRSRRDGRSSNWTMERAPARQPAAGGVRARFRSCDLTGQKAGPVKHLLLPPDRVPNAATERAA